MYGIFQALGEMGAGVSTVLCASESFPTPLQVGHFLGFAAAVGKAGNSFDANAKGQQAIFLIGAAFIVLYLEEEQGYDVSLYGEALVVNAPQFDLSQ
ncbi:Major facilitator superfamily domain general substrate transporter [Penicillium cf. griseofulvum]|nr:Major facilitator superfamily domain general substrate transporter [Penicillium cf. griseofulvum]